MNDESKDAAEQIVQQSAPQSAGSIRAIAKTMLASWLHWSPALAGLMLAIHFWRIGYTPSLSLADLGTVLSAVLLFAVFGLLAFVVLMLLPVFFLSQWVESGLMRGPPIPVADHQRLSDRARKARDRRTARGSRSPELDHPALRINLSAGSVVSFMTSALASFGCYAALFSAMYLIDVALIPKVLLCVLAFFGLIEVVLIGSANAPWLRRRLRYLRRPHMQWWLLFVMYMGAWPMVLLPFISMQPGYLESRSFFFVIGLVFIPFLHWIWFVGLRVHKAEFWTVKIMLIAFVMLFSSMPKAAADLAMDTFGLGMMRNVDLVLTARGCQIAQAAWSQRACVPSPRVGVEAYRLQNVEVLTRIGAHYYVGAPGAMRDEALPRFPIPEDEVLSWRRMPPPKQPSGAAPVKPGALQAAPPAGSKTPPASPPGP